MSFRALKSMSFWLIAVPIALSFLVRDASSAGATFTYDLAGRVTAVWYDNGMCVTYAYDAAGNRTAQTNATAVSPAWGSGVWGCFLWTP